MLAIRFQRIGRKNDPAFRIVVTEKRSPPKSGELEILGSYHPKTKETVLKTERILYWLSQGAKPSPTVHNLLVSKGIIQGRKINVVRIVPSTQAVSLTQAVPSTQVVPSTQAVPSSEDEKSKEEAREN